MYKFAYPEKVKTQYGGYIYPLSYGIPEEVVVDEIPPKERLFAPLIPGDFSTYIYDFDMEEEYNNDYRKSYFGYTWKKGGWDCLRHYEILANGCIPYFTDLEECPQNTCAFLPKDLLLKAKKIRGLAEEKIVDKEAFEEDYYEIANQLLSYTKKHLTTKAMAQYILDVTNNQDAKTALILTGWFKERHCNYTRELMMHGFKKLLGGRNVCDSPKLDYLYKIKDKSLERQKRYDVRRFAFNFGFSLDDPDIDRDNIEQRIKNKEFDIIIIPDVFYDFIRGKLNLKGDQLPFWDVIEPNYPASKIIFVDGEDRPEFSERMMSIILNKGYGYYFRREIY